jgi:hypothetical protein
VSGGGALAVVDRFFRGCAQQADEFANLLTNGEVVDRTVNQRGARKCAMDVDASYRSPMHGYEITLFAKELAEGITLTLADAVPA